jgi:ABC-2 type transport system permease protein
MTDHPKDMPINDPLANDDKDSILPEHKDGNTEVSAIESDSIKTANPPHPQEEVAAKPDATAAESSPVATDDLKTHSLNSDDCDSSDLSTNNLELGELALGDLNVGDLNIDNLNVGDLELSELAIGNLELGHLNIGDLTGDESAINELETNELVATSSAANLPSEQAPQPAIATDADLSTTSDLNNTQDSPARIQLTKKTEQAATSATIITASSLLTAAKDSIEEASIEEDAIQADSAKDSQSIENAVSAVPLVNAAGVAQAANNATHVDPAVAATDFDNPVDEYTNANQGFFSAFLQTLAAVFKDKGVLLMIIVAPIIYGFFYPWPYSAEVVNQVPVGIIDYDHSSLSNTLAQYSAASPQLQTHSFLNEQAAIEAIWRDEIAGYMIIPAGLEKKVKSSQPASVSVIGNGGYLLLNKNVQIGFLKAVSTVSAGIEIKKSVAKGAYAATAQANTQAVPLHITPLYNKSEGYGAYVVPGVSILILQQTLMMGTALLISTLYEQRRHHTSARGWLGRIFALSFLGFIMGCFYYGWVFDTHDYARGANLTGSLVFLAIYFPAVAALGCFLGLWFRERERGLQILIVSSLPLFFISDYPWPADQLPTILQYLRWLIPSSSGINTSVQLNQMGASLTQVLPRLFILAALFVLYYTAILLLESSRKRRAVP